MNLLEGRGAPPIPSPDEHACPAAAPGVRVLVVADVRMHREGLTAALGSANGVEVVAALAQPPLDLAALAPQIVLYDVSCVDALAAVRALLRREDAVKVVAVAISEDERDLLAYAEAGVSGYVTREQSVEDAVDAIKAAARDETICTPRVSAALLRHVAALAADREQHPHAPLSLTVRELEVVGLIDRGMSNKQIASALQIEVPTVKNHVHNLLEKLNVERRGEAAARLRGMTADTDPVR